MSAIRTNAARASAVDTVGAAGAVSAWSVDRAMIVGGLLVGVVLGQAGGFLGPGPAQNMAYALSSIGLVVGAGLLTARTAALGRTASAVGFGLVAVAEIAIWSGGPGATAALAAGALFSAPALLLVSSPRLLPAWVRVAGGVTAVAWAIYAAAYLLDPAATPSMTLQVAAYILLSVTVLGWAIETARSDGALAR